MMKRWFVLFALMLSGCASYQADKYGNYNDVELTGQEAQVIAHDITAYLQQTAGVKKVINLDHDGSLFATTLTNTLRQSGIGVAQQQVAYNKLRYRVEYINPTQFFVTVSLGYSHFSRIWALQDNRLIPLPVRTIYGGDHERH